MKHRDTLETASSVQQALSMLQYTKLHDEPILVPHHLALANASSPLFQEKKDALPKNAASFSASSFNLNSNFDLKFLLGLLLLNLSAARAQQQPIENPSGGIFGALGVLLLLLMFGCIGVVACYAKCKDWCCPDSDSSSNRP